MNSNFEDVATLNFLQGGGKMGELIRTHDWESTELGLPATWPQSLRSALSICLHSSVPTAIYWGEDLCLLYNDAWASIPGDRHPHVLGRPAHAVWSDIWDVVGPQLQTVVSEAEGLSAFDQMLLMRRETNLCETYWDYSFTPIHGEQGGVAGVFNQGHETTDRVLSERKREADSLRQRRMFEQAPGFITILGGANHTFEFVNESYRRLFGNRDFIGRTIYEAFPELAGQGFYEWLDQVFTSGERLVSHSTPIILKYPGAPAEQRFLDFIYEPVLDDSGEVTGIFCEGFDVTDAHISRSALELSESALREESRNFEILNLVNTELAGNLDLSQLIQTVTDAGIDLTGASFGAYFENRADESGWHQHLFTLSGSAQNNFSRLSLSAGQPPFNSAFTRGGVVRANDVLFDLRTENASVEAESSSSFARIKSYLAVSVVSRCGLLLGGLFYGDSEPGKFTARHERLMSALAGQAAIAIDTAHLFQDVKRANETLEQRVEARSLELTAAHAALRQSQKMEAIGQLTGGIAHDFNNLLAGIIGSLEMIGRRVEGGRTDSLPRYVNAARDSALRAATLTQRLLAFSRRQTLDPKPTEVNRLVLGMKELITRTVGPAITLKLTATHDLWLTKIDGVQLESALLNLAINARDAMPNGGQIVIETSNVLQRMDPEGPEQGQPIDFISIQLSDTGFGIAPEILERIFDPFFTTKPLGQGTGLGLSMIHGFVHQSGGNVNVQSTPGLGTTVSIYLPRYVGDIEEMTTATLPESAPRMVGIAVLVIDDEPHLRMLMTEVLREEGYIVLEAPDGPTGLELLQTKPTIELLITDVGLPGGMNGRQVADAARVLKPKLKVLFVTGYAESAAVGNGQLENGMAVITKPFSMAHLTQQAKEMIESSGQEAG
jgi:signal transduction histidine kinase/CheY-like chemotaxis protein/PAS domain-containing protein